MSKKRIKDGCLAIVLKGATVKKRIFFFGFLCVSLIGLSWYSASFFTTEKYECIADPLLSDECRASLETYVADALKNKKEPLLLIQELQKNFPVLKKITIAYLPSCICVTVSAHEPLCVINDSVAMIANHDVCAKNIFSSIALKTCPSLTVAQESMGTIQQLLPKIFALIPTDFYHLYDLVVTNDHSLRLVDKANPQFAIMYSVDRPFSSEIVAQCDRLKENMLVSGSFNKGVEWIADIRFADYIVTYKG
jgi:hypothetical protein